MFRLSRIKKYLSSNRIDYEHKDVSQNIDLEKDMKKYLVTELFLYLLFIKNFWGKKDN